MSHSVNPVDNNKNEIQVLNINSIQDKVQSNSNKNVAEELLKESNNYLLDSNQKKEQAQQYLQAALALEKMADAVRLRAQQLRNGEIDKNKAIDEVTAAIKGALEFPIPPHATAETLDQIADALEAKARENRMKAEDLIKDAKGSAELSLKLQEQAELIVQKELKLSDLSLKSIISRNEGLKMVFEKLGVFKLDAQYKEQVAYAQKKSQEQAQKS